MSVYDAVRLYKSLPDGVGAGVRVAVIASSGASGTSERHRNTRSPTPSRSTTVTQFFFCPMHFLTCAECLLQNKY